MSSTGERAPGPRIGAVAPLQPGDPRQVGRYRLTGRLGAGGMGTVYLGRADDGPPVAVKVVHPELAGDPEFRARFADEAAAARRVAPFCTARVLDADPAAAPPYLVTEYVDGVPLGTAVAEGGPLDASTLHGVALGVAAALAAVHAAGVVHRDLKPGNVLLSLSGPRVIDFGIARALDVTRQHTQVGMLVGTPGWMAPEQFRGGSVGPPADVFSWGSLVAYAATGRNPWGSAGGMALPPAELAHRIVAGAPDLAGLDGPLRRLVERALAKDPARRPTARQLVDELLGGEGGPRRAASAGDPTVAATRFVERTWTGLPTFAAPGGGWPGAGAAAAGGAGAAGGSPAGAGGAAGGGWPGAGPAGRPAGAPAPAGPAGASWGPPAASAAAGASWGPPAGRWTGAGGAGAPPTRVAGADPTRVLPPRGPAREATRAFPPRGPEATRGTARPEPAPPRRRRPRLLRRTPPPPPPPPAPPAAPPRPRRRRWYRRKRLLLPLALLGLLALLPREADRGATAPPRPPGLGEPARDGQLEFVVREVRCGVRSLGSGPFTRRPGGQFCLARVDVRNVKQESRTLFESFQKLHDSTGEKHGADLAARLYFRDQTLWNQVDPGESVRGTMVFDIPADRRAVALELHDGVVSGGVTVQLR